MITTKEQLRNQKRTPFYVKEDNPDRKHMSQKDAIENNKQLKADRDAVEDLKRKQTDDREAKANNPTIATEKDAVAKDGSQTASAEKEQAEKFQKEIDKLEIKFAKQKGPGSKARRDEIREKINALKG